MPTKRKLTDEQEFEAHAKWLAMGQRFGSVSALARTYGLSQSGMQQILDRVSAVTGNEGSRGTFFTPGGTCSICKVQHDRKRGNGTPASYCHSCHASYCRRTRKPYAQWSAESKLKSNARAYANTYQRRGKLAPKPCRLCGSADVQKHHKDYSKPLDVDWLCQKCHLDAHEGDPARLGKHVGEVRS